MMPPNSPVRVRIFGATDVGLVREHNEDNFLILDLDSGSLDFTSPREYDLGPRGAMLVVCDGMGGAAAGEVASLMAVQAMRRSMLEALGVKVSDPGPLAPPAPAFKWKSNSGEGRAAVVQVEPAYAQGYGTDPSGTSSDSEAITQDLLQPVGVEATAAAAAAAAAFAPESEAAPTAPVETGGDSESKPAEEASAPVVPTMVAEPAAPDESPAAEPTAKSESSAEPAAGDSPAAAESAPGPVAGAEGAASEAAAPAGSAAEGGAAISAVDTSDQTEPKVQAAPSGPPGSKEESEMHRLARRLRTAAQQANQEIFEAACADINKAGMGTTLTALLLRRNEVVVAQVGDSRAYLWRQGRLVQITHDQSLVNQLLDSGQITPEQAKLFEHSNVILQALGVQEDVEVVLSHEYLRRDDRLLICSDGLVGVVSDEEIQEILTNSENLEDAVRHLIELARSGGGPDNITVILAQVFGDGISQPIPEELAQYRTFTLEGDRPPERRTWSADYGFGTPVLGGRELSSGPLPASRWLSPASALSMAVVLGLAVAGLVLGILFYPQRTPRTDLMPLVVPCYLLVDRPGLSVVVDDVTVTSTLTPGTDVRLSPGEHRLWLSDPQDGTQRSEKLNLHVTIGERCAMKVRLLGSGTGGVLTAAGTGSGLGTTTTTGTGSLGASGGDAGAPRDAGAAPDLSAPPPDMAAPVQDASAKANVAEHPEETGQNPPIAGVGPQGQGKNKLPRKPKTPGRKVRVPTVVPLTGHGPDGGTGPGPGPSTTPEEPPPTTPNPPTTPEEPTSPATPPASGTTPPPGGGDIVTPLH